MERRIRKVEESLMEDNHLRSLVVDTAVVGSLEVVVDSCHDHLGHRDNLGLDNKTWMWLKMVSKEVGCELWYGDRKFCDGWRGVGYAVWEHGSRGGWRFNDCGSVGWLVLGNRTSWRLCPVVTL